jgi:hypothetical protein
MNKFERIYIIDKNILDYITDTNIHNILDFIMRTLMFSFGPAGNGKTHLFVEFIKNAKPPFTLVR